MVQQVPIKEKEVVVQQVPVEKIVEVEKPVYYEKQIYVENTEEIEALKQRILLLERQNQQLYAELKNRTEKVQI